jgi:DNA-binding GntR family transcriptional regulator
MRAGGEISIVDTGDLSASSGGSYRTKQDYAASILREAILSGRLAPGQRLRHEVISRQLRLSWTPVREAFRQLEGEGWLISEEHRGVIVAPLSLEDYEDIYVIRAATEPLVARFGAERVDSHTVTKLEHLADRARRLDPTRPRDLAKHLELEREFHGTLYQAAGRQRLCDTVMSLREASYRYWRASFAAVDKSPVHDQVHNDLLSACRAHDGAAAEGAVRRALEQAHHRMLQLLVPVLEEQAAHTAGHDGAQGAVN